MKRKLRKIINFLRNYFLPTEVNHNFPYALRNENLVGVILVALIIKSLSFASWLVMPKLPFFADITSGLIVQLTNEQRQLAGLSPLVQSPILNQVAHDKAQDMLAKDYFNHNSPDGLSPWHWFTKNGYAYLYAGENLAVDFFESREVVQAWLNSPTHRFNLLNQNYREIGVAVVSGQLQGHQTTLVVQVFGTPKTKLAQAKAVPRPTPTPIPTPTRLKPQPSLSPSITVSPSPVIAGEEISFISSPEPELSVSPTLSPTSTATSAEPVFAGLTKEPKDLSVARLAETVLSLAIEPKPILFALAAYLGLALLLSLFTKIYTPYPRAVLGATLALAGIIGIAYLPGAEQAFYLSIKILGV